MKSKKKLAILVGSLVMVVVLLATLLPLVVFAAVPQRINYQGYLTDSAGNPVNGSVSVVFSIYGAATGGTAIWTETQTVVVNNGSFNVQLGSVNSLPSPFPGSPTYLGIKVGADPEMTPRQLLASAPYALNADTVDGLHSTAFVLKSGDTMSASSNNAVLTVTNTGNGDGVVGNASGINSVGVSGSNTGINGIGVYGVALDSTSIGVYGSGGSRGGYFTTPGDGIAVVGSGGNRGGFFTTTMDHGMGLEGHVTGSNGYGLCGSNTGINGIGVYGVALDSTSIGVYGRGGLYGGYFYAGGTNGTGIQAIGGPGGKAAIFQGNVQILSLDGGTTVMELGQGLDYAEGFDVAGDQGIAPGSVLVIDPNNPGNLTLSRTPYDTKVAGIMAGANGLGSGVRLGSGNSDYSVALAGRVYCNVDATEQGVEPGDLLTTSATPGYAMKVIDYEHAQGAILGKAMERLEKGQKGQILVLVTLQ
jgi:hypothetical protein